MKRFLLFLTLILVFLFTPKFVNADSSLEYTSFNSNITVNKDTSITVVETIKVNFLSSHHGIFRNIPADIEVLSIKDDKNQDYKYKVTGGNVKELKIGDPDKTITGEHTYIISYQVRDIIKEFPDHYELYWNVTGSDWDSFLPSPTAQINSSYAKIIKAKCFAGDIGTSIENCEVDFSDNLAAFRSQSATGVGSDFTIVVGFDKNNEFIFPTRLEKTISFLLKHWIYFLTPLPFAVPLYFWYKKGRDLRYIGDNIYFEPENKKSKTVSIFERKFIPLVYSPIKSLTPAQIGTLIDQKVDTADIIAEIVELARLGYLKIKRLPKKGLLGKDDYGFTDLNKDLSGLKNYQKEIMDGLFKSGSPVLVSELKNKFYKTLKSFKEKLYEDMNSQKFFDGNPEKIRQKWLVFIIFLATAGFLLVVTNDFLAIALVMFFSLLGFIVTRAMPRRTPKGYALFRQIEGLRWYLKKGLWRQEIAEKNLFIDEILPLAITLGVVKQISKDMQELGMKPPTYVSQAVVTSNFASSFGSLESGLAKSLTSSPSGSSSSGFSSGGGFSGGGGGGGGGGGW